MIKKRVSKIDKNRIISLRKTGKTIVEIGKLLGRPKSTISRLTSGLVFTKKVQKLIEVRGFGSKIKAENDWKKARLKAKSVIKKLSKKDKILIAAALYWGEGNKTEFNIINSDPILLATMVNCLRNSGIKNEDIKIGIRLYNGIKKGKAVSFWSRILTIPKKSIIYFEHINKAPSGKLLYGMCRVRVKKRGRYF